jgi:hypothetical protein
LTSRNIAIILNRRHSTPLLLYTFEPNTFIFRVSVAAEGGNVKVKRHLKIEIKQNIGPAAHTSLMFPLLVLHKIPSFLQPWH